MTFRQWQARQIDEIATRELFLFAINTAEFRQAIHYGLVNLANKRRKGGYSVPGGLAFFWEKSASDIFEYLSSKDPGKYEFKKALKLAKRWADMAAKMYLAQVSSDWQLVSMGKTWGSYGCFSPADRREVGRQFLIHYDEMINGYWVDLEKGVKISTLRGQFGR